MRQVQLRAKLLVVGAEAHIFDGATNDRDELVGLERLAEVVEGPALHRFDGMPLRTVGGHDDDPKSAGGVDESALDRIEAIIFSMTAAERAKPSVINGPRRERIARGSGVQVYDVNQLLKQFADTRKLMKQFQSASGKGKKRMRFPGMPPNVGF